MSRTYYAASYGPRYGDPIATIVAVVPLHDDRPSLVRDRVNDALMRAVAFDTEEYPAYCTRDHGTEDEESIEDCPLCTPEFSVVDAYSYRACDLFTADELREHRDDLRNGRLVFLHP